MSDEETHDLADEHPGTPAEWIADLELHQEIARRIVVRFARSSGSFLHADTIKLEPVDLGWFRVELETEDGNGVILEGQHNCRRVIEHSWSALCGVAIAYAKKFDLRRMRGEIEIGGEKGEVLNDPSTTRKVLNLTDEAGAFTEDDDEDGEVGVRKDLADARKYIRDLEKRLRRSHERDEDRAEMRHALDRKAHRGAAELAQGMIDFARYKEEVIRKDLEEAVGNARVDFVLEEMMKHGGTRIPVVMDALAHWLMTAGGRRNPNQVPDFPPQFMLWFLELVGAEQFGVFSSLLLQATTIAPTDAGYRQRWSDTLSLVNNTIAEAPFPDDIASMMRPWGRKACEVLQIDPHVFSRICFGEGVEKEPPEQPNEGDA